MSAASSTSPAALIVVDAQGERQIEPTLLPLRVGTGTDSSLRLPGPGGGPVALIDMLDGHPFIQPVRGENALRLNNEPLTGSQRLNDGDRLEFYGSTVACEFAAGEFRLIVKLEDSAYVTQAPELPDTAASAADEAIVPTTFQRAAEVAAAPEEAHGKPWQYAVGTVLLILALCAYLLFSAKSIRFELRPVEPDEFSIAGGWFKLPLGDRYLLRTGEYTVNVHTDGYHDFSQTLVIGDEASRVVNITQRKLPGKLVVNTVSAGGATVSIGEHLIGPAPYGPVTLEPGIYPVTVRADRHLPFEDQIEIAGYGKTQSMDVQLVPGWSDVSVTTEPAGATVFNGEAKLGQTPVVVQLDEGSHELSVVLDGFAAWDGKVRAIAAQAQDLPLIVLEPANARLLVNSVPRGANVTVNGRYRGQSPLQLSLSPATDYQIALSKSGFGRATRRVRLTAAADDTLNVDLSARAGTVDVQVMPADAQVYVDGRARGSGSMTLNLSAAPHRIEVRKDGFESVSRRVTPRPGYPQNIRVSLRSVEEVRLSGTKKTIKTSQDQVLRRVEPGTFTMGSSRRETGRRANEVLRPVTLSKPYYIAVKQVTNKDFSEFQAGHDSGSATHTALNGDRNPVVNVSWNDAAQYCNWLSSKEGLAPVYKKKFDRWVVIRPMPDGYRLPTEAEWAWAARFNGQGSTTNFAWGDKLPPTKDSGNYADESASELVPTVLPTYDDGYASTSVVGTFKANALGLFDVGGNAAEWVQDYHTVPAPGKKEPVLDPLGPERGTHHVIRGSGWRHSGITELRLSFRGFGNEPRLDVGFRIVRGSP